MGNPENPYPLTTPPRVGEIVQMRTGTKVTPAQMLAVARDSRIVYVGEAHDNPASHRLELDLLKGLAEAKPGRQALGMEMFVRSQQPVLDRWIAGELDEKAFIKESHWFENWHSDFDYYRDLLIFARDQKIPVIALNAEKSQVEAMRRKVPDPLGPVERAGLPELDLADPYQRGMVMAIFGDHVRGELQIEGFVRAQTLWDETMAESVAGYLSSPAGEGRQMLVVAGGYHVEYGFGIPRRVFRRFPASYVLIGGDEIDIPPEKQNQIMDVKLPPFPMIPFDFMVFLAYESLPQQAVRLGVEIGPAPAGRGLLVRSVEAGSNGERAGLKAGDLLLEFDGAVLADSYDLIHAVKQKKAGDHGELQIERQGRRESLDVLFQAAGSNKAPNQKR
jgi:uncharacterized iron-regulated protein